MRINYRIVFNFGGIMKKKSKKFIIGLILCLIGVIGLFGLLSDTNDKAALAFGSAALIAVGGILLFLGRKPVVVAEKSADIHKKAEAAKQNNDYFKFRVAGVTFSNGRKTRQAILRKIKWGDEPFDFVEWTIEKYDYNGAPAVGVYANGEQVGNVPKEQLAFVLDNWDRIRSVYHTDIYGGGTDDNGQPLNFGCEVTLCLNKA